MKVAIIDADLIGRKKHKFPNLACMKLSGYYKELGHNVNLKLDYDNLRDYDKAIISKVFTDTPIDKNILRLDNVSYGGTGFFFDKAPNLSYEIEHHMPDYHLYDSWVETEMKRGLKKSNFDDYLNYSIGFSTRGCFRKCPFCVNKKYNNTFKHSPIKEFFDPERKQISLWDDNFLAYPKWHEILEELKETNKYFHFRQGLDIRLMTEEKVKAFKDVKYYSDYIFAFDYIKDRELIEEKLKLWKTYIRKTTKLYIFCGFDRNNKWDKDFWKQDIIDTLERIKILMKYGCLPYIMRFNRYEESPYRGMYITLARWCNQPNCFKKQSFREFCWCNQKYHRNKDTYCSACKSMIEFEKIYPNIAKQYFDLKFEDLKKF